MCVCEQWNRKWKEKWMNYGVAVEHAECRAHLSSCCINCCVFAAWWHLKGTLFNTLTILGFIKVLDISSEKENLVETLASPTTTLQPVFSPLKCPCRSRMSVFVLVCVCEYPGLPDLKEICPETHRPAHQAITSSKQDCSRFYPFSFCDLSIICVSIIWIHKQSGRETWTSLAI